MATTLADKLWDMHVVQKKGERDLLYVDLHLLHEMNTPQAFEGLREEGRSVRRPDLTLATEDHSTPTLINAPELRGNRKEYLDLLRQNCREFGITLHPMGSPQQGIVHVIGPEMGLIQPGMVIACCDSHTTTHGAMGTLAFGIGTSQVEHVLATQTLALRRPRTMVVEITGTLATGVTAKDVALAVVHRLGTGGGQGHIIEFQGSVIEAMSMEGRMTVCNMSVEAGSRASLIAPDDVTFAYLADREYTRTTMDDRRVAGWRELRSDVDAAFDARVSIDGSRIQPTATWGTNPAQSVSLDGSVPDPSEMQDATERDAANHALQYMGLQPGTPMRAIEIDAVFIGSCTNGRIEDLRAVAEVWKGRRVAESVNVVLVPGSTSVRDQAIAEGLGQVFAEAGVELRNAGCSMCIAINGDHMKPGVRVASTSNRNFEGRQGQGVRTHLVSPAVAAASAVMGRLASPDDVEALSG